MLKIQDRIYGDNVIDEPVIEELIQTTSFQRLRGINQAGASKYLMKWKIVTRYEHCIGVMLLLQKFNAPFEEQIAGLLHDLPHTAFSHVADFVYENKEHEYHEKFYAKMLKEEEIAKILNKYHISIPKLLKKHNFKLLEQPIPNLCADRIDYSLRDLAVWKKDTKTPAQIVTDLILYQNKFVFRTLKTAQLFANIYLMEDKTIWGNPKEIACYLVLAQAIKQALKIKIMKDDDMFTTDEQVLEILKNKGDSYIREKLSYLTPAFKIRQSTADNYDYFLKTKMRFIDPLVYVKEDVKRLSEIDSRFKKAMIDHQQMHKKGWHVKIYK